MKPGSSLGSLGRRNSRWAHVPGVGGSHGRGPSGRQESGVLCLSSPEKTSCQQPLDSGSHWDLVAWPGTVSALPSKCVALCVIRVQTHQSFSFHLSGFGFDSSLFPQLTCSPLSLGLHPSTPMLSPHSCLGSRAPLRKNAASKQSVEGNGSQDGAEGFLSISSPPSL